MSTPVNDSTSTKPTSKTAQTSSEAVRETVHETAEEAKTLFGGLGERAKYVAMRTGQEVDKARKNARPYVRPVAYTAGAIIAPVPTAGVALMDLGQKVFWAGVRGMENDEKQD